MPREQIWGGQHSEKDQGQERPGSTTDAFPRRLVVKGSAPHLDSHEALPGGLAEQRHAAPELGQGTGAAGECAQTRAHADVKALEAALLPADSQKLTVVRLLRTRAQQAPPP